MSYKRKLANYRSSREKRKLTDDQELVVVKEYEDKSILTLSIDWGVSKDTILRILKDHNVMRRPPGRQPDDTRQSNRSVRTLP